MEKKILVSVVVPAFNEEGLIGRCLESLKRQDFPWGNYEILVVDNNSTDKTVEVAKRMGVRVVSEKKQGYVFALRKGCVSSGGEIIAITDADTVVPNDWLRNIYKAYQSDSRVVCVGGGTIFERKNLIGWLMEWVYNFSSPMTKTFPGYNISFRKKVYEKIGGFREEINFDADVDLCLRIRKEGKMVFLGKNKALTSGRRFRHPGAIVYNLKGMANILWLVLFKKTLFFEFGDVRE